MSNYWDYLWTTCLVSNGLSSFQFLSQAYPYLVVKLLILSEASLSEHLCASSNIWLSEAQSGYILCCMLENCRLVWGWGNNYASLVSCPDRFFLCFGCLFLHPKHRKMWSGHETNVSLCVIEIHVKNIVVFMPALKNSVACSVVQNISLHTNNPLQCKETDSLSLDSCFSTSTYKIEAVIPSGHTRFSYQYFPG